VAVKVNGADGLFVYVVNQFETKMTLNQETISTPGVIVLLYCFLSRTVLRFNCARFAILPPNWSCWIPISPPFRNFLKNIPVSAQTRKNSLYPTPAPPVKPIPHKMTAS
jgi:hypothetical protein